METSQYVSTSPNRNSVLCKVSESQTEKWLSGARGNVHMCLLFLECQSGEMDMQLNKALDVVTFSYS